MMDQPLPCIVCGVQPESIGSSPSPWQPYGATMFDAGSGHYGSTVWDMQNLSLWINVCDECLVKNSARTAAVRVVRNPSTLEFKPWTPRAD